MSLNLSSSPLKGSQHICLFICEDEQEQQETGEYLIEALDQDRLSERPLFPAELKGVTW